MAVNAGAGIIVTTRSQKRFPMMAALGVERCELEGRRFCSPPTFLAVVPLTSMEHILFDT
jgi:hypothetical protein